MMVTTSVRLVTLAVAGLLLCGFTLTPEYELRIKEDVAVCVAHARQEYASFDAFVSRVEPTSGEVAMRVLGGARGEFAFTKCLMTIRDWTWVDDRVQRVTTPARVTPKVTP